jgi:hypothetical protein
MRLWSRPFSELDRLGFLGVWREALVAQRAIKARLTGGAAAYMRHPQINRFLEHENPMQAIGCYLGHIWRESLSREYLFRTELIEIPCIDTEIMPVTNGQLLFEYFILYEKLEKRDEEAKIRLLSKFGNNAIVANPTFRIIAGEKENWEKYKLQLPERLIGAKRYYESVITS